MAGRAELRARPTPKIYVDERGKRFLLGNPSRLVTEPQRDYEKALVKKLLEEQKIKEAPKHKVRDLVRISDIRRRLDYWTHRIPFWVAYAPVLGNIVTIAQLIDVGVNEARTTFRFGKPKLREIVKHLEFEDKQAYLEDYLRQRYDRLLIDAIRENRRSRRKRYVKQIGADLLLGGVSGVATEAPKLVSAKVLELIAAGFFLPTAIMFASEALKDGLSAFNEGHERFVLKRRAKKIDRTADPYELARKFRRDIRSAVRQSKMYPGIWKRAQWQKRAAEVERLQFYVAKSIEESRDPYYDFKETQPKEYEAAMKAAVELEDLDYKEANADNLLVKEQMRRMGMTREQLKARRKVVREQEAYDFNPHIFNPRTGRMGMYTPGIKIFDYSSVFRPRGVLPTAHVR